MHLFTNSDSLTILFCWSIGSLDLWLDVDLGPITSSIGFGCQYWCFYDLTSSTNISNSPHTYTTYMRISTVPWTSRNLTRDTLQAEWANVSRGRSYLWRLSVRNSLLSECMYYKESQSPSSLYGVVAEWVECRVFTRATGIPVLWHILTFRSQFG